MNIILLSGGSGKRLWPLSNDIRSKQFLKLFKREDGTYESMTQRVYRQITAVDEQAQVTIATSKTQASSIRTQLNNEVGICVEPCRRDTFPAIALASAYLHEIKGVAENAVIVICPVDPYVETEYFQTLQRLSELVSQKDAAKLMLIGIKPTHPSEKYGYIMPETQENLSPVLSFREKPDKETAQRYIEEGGLWNGGVFSYKLGYMLAKTKELTGFSSYQELYDHYESLPKISLDYAVVEKEKSIAVLRYAGEWKDLGSWSTLSEEMADDTIGNVICDDHCKDITVINELSTPILCVGLQNLIVAASHEGVIVTDKQLSATIKPYVDSIEQQIRYAEKSWGEYLVMDVEEECITIKVTLLPGKQMKYHSHKLRDEVWTVIAGKGKAILDDKVREIGPGDTISVPAGCRHTAIAETTLKMMEVQLGKNIDVRDKEKHIYRAY